MEVTIYTTETCNYCIRAKSLLASRNIEYTEKKVGTDITSEELKGMFPGVSTVPVIIVNGNHIGGYTQLAEQIDSEYFGLQQLNG